MIGVVPEDVVLPRHDRRHRNGRAVNGSRKDRAEAVDFREPQNLSRPRRANYSMRVGKTARAFALAGSSGQAGSRSWMMRLGLMKWNPIAGWVRHVERLRGAA
jgi:hypothetical protein